MVKVPRADRRTRIAIASEQSLVTEAVKVALSSRGFETGTVRWPGDAPSRPPAPRPAFDAGLLLSELDRVSRLRAAMLVTERLKIRWAVLTSAPRGPLWGALFTAGAAVVLPSETPLDEVVAALEGLSRRPGAVIDGREELMAAWGRLQAEHEELVVRVATLTPREREVLIMLHSGDTVAGIASILEVAPATVRSQVKAVLRKLDVNSQLAAVAAYGMLLERQRSEQECESQPIASGC